jgi:GTPase SAR1 family protein
MNMFQAGVAPSELSLAKSSSANSSGLPQTPKRDAAAGDAQRLMDRMTQLVDETTLGVLGDLDRGAAAAAIRFSIWDLAGQTVFYDLLHILLTRYALYVVCFDMADMAAAGTGRADCLAYIKFWLTSVHLHAAGARVCLVGTHKDRVPERRQHEAIHRAIMDSLVGHPMLGHLVLNTRAELNFFPVDNAHAEKDATVAHLRAALEQAAKEQEYVSFQIPGPWLACLDAVRALAKDQKLQRIALGGVQTLAAKFGIDPEQLALMLKVSLLCYVSLVALNLLGDPFFLLAGVPRVRALAALR